MLFLTAKVVKVFGMNKNLFILIKTHYSLASLFFFIRILTPAAFILNFVICKIFIIFADDKHQTSFLMNILLVVILILIGTALLVAELFLIPGFGIAGIAGFIAIAGGVFCAYFYLGATAGHITLAAAVVLCAVAVYLFLRSKALDKMALQKNIDSKVDLIEGKDIHIGDLGITISRLAPMGKVRIGENDVEARSNDAFIDQQTQVRVVALEGNTVIVSPV